MLDRILKYMEDNWYYEVDDEGTRIAKIVNYEELKEFIEKLKEALENE